MPDYLALIDRLRTLAEDGADATNFDLYIEAADTIEDLVSQVDDAEAAASALRDTIVQGQAQAKPTVGPNPQRYREMSVPHESQQTAQDAMDSFYADVSAARVRHRITDVSLIANVNVQDGENETERTTCCHYGDQAKGLHMAAYLFAHRKSEWESALAVVASGKGGRS